MLGTFKAEIRKLLSVRSTYVISVLAIAICVLLSWVLLRDVNQQVKTNERAAQAAITASEAPSPEQGAESFEGMPTPEEMEAQWQEHLSTLQREIVMNSFSTMAVMLVIIVILQIIHEYRHNTIMYTLTTSNSRTKVFLAKTTTLLLYAGLVGLIGVAVSVITYYFLLNQYDLTMPAQNLEWGGALLRGLLYIWAFMSVGAIIAWLSRSVAMAIAAILIFPSTIESLLTLLLKENSIYLPFSAMTQIVLYNPNNPPESLGFAQALLVTAIYLAILYPVTWYLFLRRDAN